MDQKEQLNERPPTDPVTGQSAPQDSEQREPVTRRSMWPLLIIVLAGLAIALIAWLPAELRRDVEDVETTSSSTTTQPAPDDPATRGPAPVTPGTAPQPQGAPAQ